MKHVMGSPIPGAMSGFLDLAGIYLFSRQEVFHMERRLWIACRTEQQGDIEIGVCITQLSN